MFIVVARSEKEGDMGAIHKIFCNSMHNAVKKVRSILLVPLQFLLSTSTAIGTARRKGGQTFPHARVDDVIGGGPRPARGVSLPRRAP